MHDISYNSLELLICSSLAELEAAGGKVRSSFDALIGSAIDLVSAEMAAQSSSFCVPEDDEEASQEVNHTLSLCLDAKFEVSEAAERALVRLAEQERVLNEARTTLEQIKESLQLRTNALSVSMQICPKPGCACSSSKPEP